LGSELPFILKIKKLCFKNTELVPSERISALVADEPWAQNSHLF